MDNPHEPTVIHLRYPIVHGSETIHELAFRRPKLKDLKGCDLANLNGDVIIALLSRLSGQPPSVIGELDAADMEAAGGVIEGFFAPSPATGASGSSPSPMPTASD